MSEPLDNEQFQCAADVRREAMEEPSDAGKPTGAWLGVWCLRCGGSDATCGAKPHGNPKPQVPRLSGYQHG